VKALFDHPLPFSLTHGGFQIQIEQTRQSLLDNSVEVEFMQWWNPSQQGDIVHYFGRPTAEYIQLAHSRGFKVVVEELLTATGSRSRQELAVQRLFIRTMSTILPGALTNRMAWGAYDVADACIANTSWEAHLMNYLFRADKSRIHVVPNGVEEVFLSSPARERGQWLVCAATITERKRVLELAQGAVQAQTPIWFIGRPYSESDPYALRFFALAKAHPQVIRYEGPIGERASLAAFYRAARGFVLLSTMETRSLAAEEAAACRCPLLLSDLPWARATYGDSASYCPVTKLASQIAAALRSFYEAAPSLSPPPTPASWVQVGGQFKKVYTQVLNAVPRASSGRLTH
jgi:glycosyltransferase involved in cell wall biosynthesis